MSESAFLTESFVFGSSTFFTIGSLEVFVYISPVELTRDVIDFPTGKATCKKDSPRFGAVATFPNFSPTLILLVFGV